MTQEQFYDCMCAKMDIHNGLMEDILTQLTTIKNDINTLKTRGENASQGIYQNFACQPVCDDTRALLMTALTDSGLLDAVLNEKNNPSPADIF